MAYSIIIIALSFCLLVGACLYPYLWGIVLKARMLKALRKKARGAGFKYRRFYKNIFFVRNRSPKFDMVIYNDKKLYAVKLWSSYFVHSKLCVTKTGRVFERRRTRPVFQTTDRKYSFIESFKHKVPKTRLAKKYYRNRDVERILLIYPSYESITVYDGNRRVPLSSSDELFGKTIYSPSSFTALLLSHTPRQEKTEADEQSQKKGNNC